MRDEGVETVDGVGTEDIKYQSGSHNGHQIKQNMEVNKQNSKLF